MRACRLRTCTRLTLRQLFVNNGARIRGFLRAHGAPAKRIRRSSDGYAYFRGF
jgi:hypothetical protein